MLSRKLLRSTRAPLSFYSHRPLEALVGTAKVSGLAFATRFSEIFSRCTFSKVVRLRQAAEMLATTPTSIAEIARQAGFSSRNSFPRAFVAMCGVELSWFQREGRFEVAAKWLEFVGPRTAGTDKDELAALRDPMGRALGSFKKRDVPLGRQ